MSSRSLYTPCYVLLLPRLLPFFFFFFFNDTATTEIYTLSLHDALPIYIELVEGHGVHRPGGQLRDQRRQAAQRHRLGMRLPGGFAVGDALEHPAGGGPLLIEFRNQPLGGRHSPPPSTGGPPGG